MNATKKKQRNKKERKKKGLLLKKINDKILMKQVKYFF